MTRYLTDDPHVRFSVWNESGVAEGAVSLDEREAGRVARFLRAPKRSSEQSPLDLLGGVGKRRLRPRVSLLDVAR
ncbi:MAG TPA: hypothetical protein VK490_10115, partial [Gaiellaceae bacterium]|nr:hypothetical protein [Gaiellaceae bacterium]